jgi:hypothetical protein
LSKKQKISALTVFFIMLLFASAYAVSANAQGTATVIVNDVTGGTTDTQGTTTYSDGSSVTIIAIPDSTYAFVDWILSPSDGSGETNPTDNPLTITVSGDVTYTVTPVFEIPAVIPGRTVPQDLSTAAIIIIYPSAGGTTIPAPGTYALADATNVNLQAMPNNGWQFAYWTICGTNASHGTSPVNWTPTDNPYNVNHGYGDTYRYQAIFTPIGSSTNPTPTPTPGPNVMSMETWIIIALIAVIAVILVAFGVYSSRRKK